MKKFQSPYLLECTKGFFDDKKFLRKFEGKSYQKMCGFQIYYSNVEFYFDHYIV